MNYIFHLIPPSIHVASLCVERDGKSFYWWQPGSHCCIHYFTVKELRIRLCMGFFNRSVNPALFGKERLTLFSNTLFGKIIFWSEMISLVSGFPKYLVFLLYQESCLISFCPKHVKVNNVDPQWNLWNK